MLSALLLTFALSNQPAAAEDRGALIQNGQLIQFESALPLRENRGPEETVLKTEIHLNPFSGCVVTATTPAFSRPEIPAGAKFETAWFGRDVLELLTPESHRLVATARCWINSTLGRMNLVQEPTFLHFMDQRMAEKDLLEALGARLVGDFVKSVELGQ
jgi:hypothetical protein